VCFLHAPSIPLQLLKHLTTQRPPNAERGEFYVHAEAFAALVSIEIVPIDVSGSVGVALCVWRRLWWRIWLRGWPCTASNSRHTPAAHRFHVCQTCVAALCCCRAGCGADDVCAGQAPAEAVRRHHHDGKVGGAGGALGEQLRGSWKEAVQYIWPSSPS
jgi:hypothetical protein